MVKPRPERIYRQEGLNDRGEWVCIRMTYDENLYGKWRYYSELAETGPYRFVAGTITWEDPPDPEPIPAKPIEPAPVIPLPERRPNCRCSLIPVAA